MLHFFFNSNFGVISISTSFCIWIANNIYQKRNNLSSHSYLTDMLDVFAFLTLIAELEAAG